MTDQHASDRIDAGQDYLTEAQAARYCGLSLSAFRAQAAAHGIRSGRALGTIKKLYRRTDLQRAIEHAWQPIDADTTATPGNSTSAETRPAGASAGRSQAIPQSAKSERSSDVQSASEAVRAFWRLGLQPMQR